MKRRAKIIVNPARSLARVAVSPVQDIRRALTVEGDIRSEVEFQNDVNAMLATVGKLTALGPQIEEDVEVAISDTPAPIVTGLRGT
ncbi:MAG TPA: hypothetical protein VNO55_01735 [Polyangia bacterium]|nr:hypothetical protein [Polyangia bacterium]